LTFRKVTRTPAYVQVADQIRGAIGTGRLVPGQALAAERDLAVEFGVSRTTIREALRALQAQGMITTQGTAPLRAVVASGDALGLTDALDVLLQFGRISPLGLVDFQSILESAAIDRASLEPGTDHWQPAEEALERLQEIDHQLDAFVDADSDFHRALGAAAQSQIIDLALDATLDLLANERREALHRVLTDASGTIREDLLRRYREILDAVLVRDADTAREVLRDHLYGFYLQLFSPDPSGSNDSQARRDRER
jgi:DNA-binding FadR family transcriptional regulator